MKTVEMLKGQAMNVSTKEDVVKVLNKIVKYKINKNEFKYFDMVEQVTGILADKCCDITKEYLYVPSIELTPGASITDIVNLIRYCMELKDIRYIQQLMSDINFTSGYLKSLVNHNK